MTKKSNAYKNLPCFNPEKPWVNTRAEKINMLARALHLA